MLPKPRISPQKGWGRPMWVCRGHVIGYLGATPMQAYMFWLMSSLKPIDWIERRRAAWESQEP